MRPILAQIATRSRKEAVLFDCAGKKNCYGFVKV
jgi:hypothetical protein